MYFAVLIARCGLELGIVGARLACICLEWADLVLIVGLLDVSWWFDVGLLIV